MVQNETLVLLVLGWIRAEVGLHWVLRIVWLVPLAESTGVVVYNVLFAAGEAPL
jgi:hypothetical protein